MSDPLTQADITRLKGLLKPQETDTPGSLTAGVLGEITPNKVVGGINKSYAEYTQAQDERRASQNIFQQAGTELVAKPLKIAAFLPRVVAGGITELGKTLEEFAITYGGAALPGVSRDEASNFAVSQVTNTEKGNSISDKIFGYETQSFAEYKEGIDKFLSENPLATDAEKKYYPMILPVLMLGAEMMPYGNTKKGLGDLVVKLTNDATEKASLKTLKGAGIEGELATRISKYIPGANNERAVREVVGLEAQRFGQQLATEAQVDLKALAATVGAKASDIPVQSSDITTVFSPRKKYEFKKDLVPKDISTNDYLHEVSYKNPSAARLAEEVGYYSDDVISARLERMPASGQDAFFEINALKSQLADDIRLQSLKNDMAIRVQKKELAAQMAEQSRSVSLKPVDVSDFSDAVGRDPELKALTEKFPNAARAARGIEDSPNTQRLFDEMSADEQDAFIEMRSRAIPEVVPEPPLVKNIYKQGDVDPNPNPKEKTRFDKIANKYPDSARVLDMDQNLPETQAAFDELGARDKDAFFELDAIRQQALMEKPPKRVIRETPLDPSVNNLSPALTSIDGTFGPGTLTKSNLAAARAAEKEMFDEITAVLDLYRNGKSAPAPSWVPRHLSMFSTMENLVDWLDRGFTPDVLGSPEWELYNVIKGRIAKKIGITAEPLHNNAPDIISAALHADMWDPQGGKGIFPQQTGVVKNDAVKPEDAVTEFNNTTTYAEYAETRAPQIPEVKTEVETKFEKFRASIPWKKLRDFGGTVESRRDIFSISQKVLAEYWDDARFVFDKFNNAKMVWLKDKRAAVKEMEVDIIEKYNIKPGSDKSWDVVHWGEGKKGPAEKEQLFAKWGDKEAQEIIAAEQWFRKRYDNFIDEWNARNAVLYPHRPKLNKRTNYFHHGDLQSETASGLNNLMEGVGLTSGGDRTRFTDVVPLAGRVVDKIKGTKTANFIASKLPTRSYIPFDKARIGNKNEFDAVTGFRRYSEFAIYARHIDPEIVRMNSWIKFLKKETGYKSAGDAGNLGAYIKQVEDWTADLAGHTNPVDAKLNASLGTGSKGILNFLSYVNTRAKINAVMFSPSAFLSQAMNVPYMIMMSGNRNFARGYWSYQTEVLHDLLGTNKNFKPLWHDSPLVQERLEGFEIRNQFNIGMIENSKQLGGYILGSWDIVTVKMGQAALYKKARSRGLGHAQAIRWADDQLRSIIADRGVGGTALVQKSKTLQLVAPFQVEITQQFYKQIDEFGGRPKTPEQIKMWDAKYKKIIRAYVAITALDFVLEAIRGEGGYMNPVDAFGDAYDTYRDDTLSAKDKAIQVPGRIAGEFVGGIPVVGNPSAKLVGWLSGTQDKMKDAAGDGDPTRYGSTPLVFNAMNFSEEEGGIMNIVYSLGSPFGGGKQVEKTAQGIDAYFKGEVLDWEGNKVMDAKSATEGVTGKWGAVQQALFGKWTTNFKYKEDVRNEMKTLFYDNRLLKKQGNTDEIKSNLRALSRQTLDVYEEVAKEEKKKIVATKVKQIGTVARHLDDIALDYRKAKFMSEETDSPEEKAQHEKEMAGYKSLAGEVIGNLTEEQEAYLTEYRLREKEKDAAQKAEDRKNPETRLKHAVDSTHALLTHPRQTLNIWRNAQRVEDSIGGVGGKGIVVPKRLDKDKIEEWAEREAIEKGVDRDDYHVGHIIPNGLGGLYVEDNLLLETPEENRAWIKMESYLMDAVKTETINRADAIELILAYKGADGRDILTAAQIKEMVGVDEFKGDDFEYLEEFEQSRGWNDWGRNIWPMADTANTNRNDGHRRTFWDELSGEPTKKGID